MFSYFRRTSSNPSKTQFPSPYYHMSTYYFPSPHPDPHPYNPYIDNEVPHNPYLFHRDLFDCVYDHFVTPGFSDYSDNESYEDIQDSVIIACDDLFDLYEYYPKYVWSPFIWNRIGTRQLLPLYNLNIDFILFLSHNDHYTTDTD
jgi:hypothetical protein